MKPYIVNFACLQMRAVMFNRPHALRDGVIKDTVGSGRWLR